jgi:RNA polymerase sigma-70 factor (ECF subfamily)
MTDHRQLIKECINGKPASQKALYDLFAESMMAVCYRYTKSVADAEDVLQDGFVKVFRNLRHYREEGELGAWIRRIMVNTAINFLKKKREYQYDMSFLHEPLHPVSEENPEIKLRTKELADLIRQLPSGYQTIFNLHAVEGYTHVEIGQMMGISEGTSRSQYMRARNLLITWIEKHSSEPQIKSYGG